MMFFIYNNLQIFSDEVRDADKSTHLRKTYTPYLLLLVPKPEFGNPYVLKSLFWLGFNFGLQCFGLAFKNGQHIAAIHKKTRNLILVWVEI